MSIIIKNLEQQKKMRIAGRLAARVLEMIEDHVRPGTATGELDRVCHDYIVGELGCIPAPLNYRGFPKSICTSVNHQVCHGIPGKRKLKNGDIVNIDVTVIKDGYHGDTSRMFLIGRPSVQAQRLVEKTREALWRGIAAVAPGKHLGDIGHAIQSFAERNRYGVVRNYCGHGIGTRFHEEPQVLHFGRPGAGPELEPGMTFTIEPMLNAGGHNVRVLADKWTVVTRDHSLSAQWEHTLLVTDTGCEVLTLRSGEERPVFPAGADRE